MTYIAWCLSTHSCILCYILNIERCATPPLLVSNLHSSPIPPGEQHSAMQWREAKAAKGWIWITAGGQHRRECGRIRIGSNLANLELVPQVVH